MFHRHGLHAVCTLAVFAMGMPAAGQYYIQGGNALDANNRVGSGGINTARPQYQPNATNRIITGNVTSGAAFQGYSPIRDSSSFYLGAAPGTLGAPGRFSPGLGSNLGGLPSDQLATFRRDSVAINELRTLPASPNLRPLPYYPLGSTVADTGQILQRINQPGTSQIRSSHVPIHRDLYTAPTSPLDAARRLQPGTPLDFDARMVRVDTGAVVGGPVNQRLLGSPLFGGVRQVPLSQLAGQIDRMGGPPDADPRAGLPDRTNPATLAQQRRAAGLAGPDDQAAMQDRRLTQQALQAGREPSVFDANAGGVPSADQATDPQGRLSRPIRADDETAAGSLARPLAQSDRFRRVYTPAEDPSLRLFTGTADERIQEQMTEARSLLGEQRYYDAARRYEMAHAIDLQNPLPLFGRGMALLAAGDYTSSANDLFMAIQLAGPRAADLEFGPFLPDLDTLDRRRAFLEQQLETYEDFRLRFLLGWAEYLSGMPELGLRNMRHSAEAAPPSMDAVRRFVEALSQRAATQPAAATTQPG